MTREEHDHFEVMVKDMDEIEADRLAKTYEESMQDEWVYTDPIEEQVWDNEEYRD